MPPDGRYILSTSRSITGVKISPPPFLKRKYSYRLRQRIMMPSPDAYNPKYTILSSVQNKSPTNFRGNSVEGMRAR